MRSDFFYSNLRKFVKNLADLSRPHNPEDFLNEKLEEANKYGVEFAFAFMDDLVHLIHDHSKYFWSESHREKISVWIMSHASFVYDIDDIFPDPYDPTVYKDKIRHTNIPQPAIALIHYYNGEPITSENKKDMAQRYRYNRKESGQSLYQTYLRIVDTPRYNAENTRISICKKYENQIIESNLLKNATVIKKFKSELKKAGAARKNNNRL